MKAIQRRPLSLARLSEDDGLSLIEILAALLLLAIVTAGAVPLFVGGLRASLASRFETQAKNLAQERLEVMRNLPFYVVSTTSSTPSECWTEPGRTDPRVAGVVKCDYRDLLDTYFRSAVTPAPTNPPNPPTVGGYVSATNQMSADEVSAKLLLPYYRFVLNPVPGFEQGRFSQVVVSQFLDASRNVVTPPSTYNTQNANTELPPSRFLGVTVITRWTLGSQSKKYVTFSQIAEGAVEATSVSLFSEATSVAVRSELNSLTRIEALAGISRSEAAVAGATSASTYAQGGYAAFVPGDRLDGLYRTASGPPPSSSVRGDPGALALVADSASNTYARLRRTEAESTGVTVGTNPGEPSVPAVAPGTNFSTGSLVAESAPLLDFTFDNGDSAPAPLFPASGLPNDVQRPFVWIAGTGPAHSAIGRTYLTSKRGAGHFAKSGARASTQEIHIMPTTFAPEGLVIVRLTASEISCNATGSSTTGTATYSGYIKFYDVGAESGAVPGYVQTDFNQTLQPEVFNPNTPVSVGIGECPGENCVAPPRFLGDYIKGWSVLTQATTSSTGGASISSSLDGIVRVTTQNTRAANPETPLVPDNGSAIEVRLGVLSCSAEDRRP